jgi:ElaB/YqjD/DUF883 family membrane-anchored ribosome-binding protein
MDTNNTNQTSTQALSGAADAVTALADKVQQTVKQTQEHLNELQQDLVDRTKYAARSTDTFVREQPWNAVGAALAAGFILGLIVGRR